MAEVRSFVGDLPRPDGLDARFQCVHEVVVIGLPHETLGEEVGAAVVLKKGATAEAGELRQFVKPCPRSWAA